MARAAAAKAAPNHKVTLGERELTVPRFKGLKGLIAASIIARMVREVPEVNEEVNTYAKEFGERNKVKVTPAIAKLPRYAHLGLTTEDFPAEGFVELPDYPSPMAMTLHALPLLLDLARKEVLRLLAIIVIDNRTLEQAEDDECVDEVLDKEGKRISREGDLDELLRLLTVAGEILDEQLADQRDNLGKLLDRVPFLKAIFNGPPASEATTEALSDLEIESLTSSTSSGSTTDGPDATLSSAAASSS